MKFNLSKEEEQKINTLIEEKETNIIMADMLLDFFSYVDVIKSCDTTDNYLEQMCDFWQIDINEEENYSILKSRIIDDIKELNPRLIKDNPYYKNIRFQNEKIGDYSLCYDKYNSFQGFAYDDIEINKEFYIEKSKVGFYREALRYPVLKYKKDVWMSITPNEIKTMEKPIESAHGNVLVVGLGLGYFQYMISNKDNVKKITIVEKDKNVIELFKKFILPSFKYKNKIVIINDDAFKYIENVKEKFDYAFIDIWHDPNDGLPLYLRFKKIEHKLGDIKVDYWLETSLIALFNRYVIALIKEQMDGIDEKEYLKAKCFEDKLINALYFQTKNVEFKSYVDVCKLLENQDLIKKICNEIF